ncbi:MAG: hypothetical protein OEM20_00240 [Gammaproteobacteria bacterium]|nr:hypothetical protein [Gammaproteobacteria bacterium]
MPIKYSIDEDLGVVFTTASEVLTENELLEHKRKLILDPNFKPGFVELSDVRFVSDLAISAAGLERFVAQDESDSERLKDFKLAIVVSGALEFGMGAMYEMMSRENNVDVRIFRDLRLAKEWLHIPK